MITAERAKQHSKEELQALIVFAVDNMDKSLLENTLVTVYNILLDRQNQKSRDKFYKNNLERLV